MDDSSPRQPPGDSIVYEPANAWVGADEFDSSCRGEDTSTNRGGLVGVSVEEQRSWCEMLGRVNATMASEVRRLTVASCIFSTSCACPLHLQAACHTSLGYEHV